MANRYEVAKPAAERLRAVRDDYLMATPDKTDTAYAVLTSAAETIDDLLAACRKFDPRGICSTNRNIPDNMVVSFDMSMGELREYRAAIAKAAGECAPQLEGAALARTFA